MTASRSTSIAGRSALAFTTALLVGLAQSTPPNGLPPASDASIQSSGETSTNVVDARRAAMLQALRQAMTNGPASGGTTLAAPPVGPVPAASPTPTVDAGPPAVIGPAAPAVTPSVPTPTAAPRAPIELPPSPGAPPPSSRPAPTPAGPMAGPASSAPGYTYSLIAAPLVPQIFDEYSKLTGRTVLHPSNISGTVTLNTVGNLTREEAIQAFQGALALNGITLIEQGEKFVKAVPVANSVQEGGAIIANAAADLPDTEAYVTQIVQLKAAIPSEVSTVLQSFAKTPQGIVPIDSSMILIIRDYASNVRRMLDIIERVDIEPESEYLLEVIPIKYGRVSDLFNTMSALISGTGGATVNSPEMTGPTMRTVGSFGGGSRLGSSGSLRARSNQPYQNTGYGNQNYGSGYRPYGDDVTPLGASTTPQPGSSSSSFQSRLNNILSKAAGSEEANEVLGDARIVPDERSNNLIVYANREDMKMITNIVSKVDVLLAQVLIEGIVMAVGIKDNVDVGVSWYQTPRRFGEDFSGAGAINNGFFGILTNFPSASPSGFSYWARIGDDLNVAVQAIASDSKVRILQRPRIQTSHAVPGAFFSGSTVPYVTGFSDYAYGGVGSSRSQVQQIQVGVQLDVVPYITPDGLVVLDVFQDISQVEGFVKIDNNDVPTTTSRSASATLSVRDGETIMLGGYIEDTRDNNKSGVPVLKDIPVLGALFRASSKKNSRNELILLMKVTVLESPTEASELATAERAKLPSLMKAQKEFGVGDDQ